jgi:geranylgeranyl diphosphate synthase type II
MLETYRLRVEKALELSIENLGAPSRLRDACAYACLNGGKRLRPILVLLIANALSSKREVMEAALSVEYFHTASLIADDLPCMDNDDTRRNKPSLHKVFEESVALLASYTLIAAGYGGIYEASRKLKELEPALVEQGDATLGLCLETVSRCAGLKGATYGQFLDLFPPDASYETILTIVESKTSTLFEISFVFGWLFGGGDRSRLDEVRSAAAHFGLAFQLADDLQDYVQDSKQQSPVNFARALGVERAHALFQEELVQFTGALSNLGLLSEPFQQICSRLDASVALV